MTDLDALFEINMVDGDDFRSATRQLGLEVREQGSIKRLDGASALAFLLAIAPDALATIRSLLENWLGQRRTVTVRAGGVVIETDSLDDLERIIAALKSTP